MEDAARKALKEAGPDKDGIQKLIGRGGEFQARIIAAIREFSLNNQYADEEVSSSFGYPNDYKVKRVAEQVATLRKLFPELKDATYDENIAVGSIPEGAEGWFTIPRWENYGEAVAKVFTALGSKRRFYNYREGQTGPEHLRQHTKTMQAFQKLSDEQKGNDILIVPAQFGLRHRGRSVRRAREVMTPNEFGFGAFAVGCMILTHPEREVQWEQLHVDCAGDEYSPGAVGRFAGAPVFSFGVDKLRFDARWVGSPAHYWGSASGFLPQ